MLPPDAEERFRRIEDNLVVTAELQRRGEARLQEEVARLKAIQDAMARWMDGFEDRQKELEVKLNALTDAQIRSEEGVRQSQAETREMKAAIADLSRTVAELSLTVDRYLRARTNGGGT